MFLAGIMIPLEGIIVPLYFTMRSTPFASTVALSALVLKERVLPIQWVGIGVALVGIAVLAL